MAKVLVFGGIACAAVVVAGTLYATRGGEDAPAADGGAPATGPAGSAATPDPGTPSADTWCQREPYAGWTPVDDGQPVPAEPIVRNVAGQHGGTISLSTAGDLGALHPLAPEGATAQEFRALIWDNLVTYDNAAWQHVPNLATRWESSDDKLVWTFHLRTGVIWSDGEPFDADDVIFTYQALFDDKFVASTKDSLRDSQGRFPKVEKIDSHAVRFTLQEIDAIFVDHVSYVYIMPQHLWQASHEAGTFQHELKDKNPATLAKMVGTGAFRLVDYKSAEALIFERSKTHFRFGRDGNRLPYCDRLVVRIVPDMNTLYTKFIAGDFDVLNSLRPEDYDDARAHEQAKNFTVYALGPALGGNYITFNQNTGSNPETGAPYLAPWKVKVFRQTAFRQAISHAIDREKMVEILLKGRGVPGYHYTGVANRTWYSEGLPEFPYDPAKAKALLEGIGLVDRDGDGIRETPEGEPFRFTIVTNTENNTRIQAGNMMKTDFRAIGLDADLRGMAFKTLVPMLESQFDYDAVILGWGSAVPPDPLGGKNIIPSSGVLHMWFPKQKSPSTEWEAEIDRVFGEMGRTPDEIARKQVWRRVSEILGREQPQIFLFDSNVYVGVRNKFDNLKPSILRPYAYWNVYEMAVRQ